MSKNNTSYIWRVCTTVDNRKMKVFKLLLQISAVCSVWHIRVYLLTLKAIKDEDDRMRPRRDKPCSMDEALSLACELEAFRLLDGGW